MSIRGASATIGVISEREGIVALPDSIESSIGEEVDSAAAAVASGGGRAGSRPAEEGVLVAGGGGGADGKNVTAVVAGAKGVGGRGAGAAVGIVA